VSHAARVVWLPPSPRPVRPMPGLRFCITGSGACVRSKSVFLALSSLTSFAEFTRLTRCLSRLGRISPVRLQPGSRPRTASDSLQAPKESPEMRFTCGGHSCRELVLQETPVLLPPQAQRRGTSPEG
jgi:hypothetical protein